MVDLNSLAVFASVVDAGSFTGGAKTLGLPKGSVSRKISRLETALGVRLLNRTTRKLSLTDVGRAYYEQCRKGLGEIDAANQLVRDTRTTPMGVIRISAPADSGRVGMGNWIEEYLKRYERTKVELVLTDEFVDLVDQRIDLAFRSGPLMDSSLVARKLAPSHRILCASPEYIKRRGRPVSLDALSEHDCIVHGDSVTGATWQLRGPDADAAIGVEARIAAGNVGFVQRCALSGLGIALIPESVARDDVHAKRLINVLDSYSSPSMGLYAIYPSNRHLSVNVRAFLDLAVEMIEGGTV